MKRLRRFISRIGRGMKVEVLSFLGSLNLVELIVWIMEIEEYFDEANNPKIYIFGLDKMKVHTDL